MARIGSGIPHFHSYSLDKNLVTRLRSLPVRQRNVVSSCRAKCEPMTLLLWMKGSQILKNSYSTPLKFCEGLLFVWAVIHMLFHNMDASSLFFTLIIF